MLPSVDDEFCSHSQKNKTMQGRIGLFSVSIIVSLSIFAWLISDYRTSDSQGEIPFSFQSFRSSPSIVKESTKTFGGEPTLSSDETLPNIVFFLVDDQGYADVGFNAEDKNFSTFTPFIDGLSKSSLKLGKYYTEHLCTPARAALLTGKYPIHNGMQYEVIGDTSPFGLPLTEKLLPEYLESLGYKSHIVGKWHLGHFNAHFLPMMRGFHSHVGYYNGEIDYYTHGFTIDDDDYTDFHKDAMPYDSEEYSVHVYMDEVEQMIKEHPTDPFFLFYSQQAVHMPLKNPPEGFITAQQVDAANDLYGSKSRNTFAQISAALDKSLSHLVDVLIANGMYENTIIIYASDNGGCSGYGANNYPLKGQKNSLFEGGIRVNSFIHSPLLPEELKGQTFDELFHKVDWLPTIVTGILGKELDQRHVDGIDQWGNLMASEQNFRTEILHNIEVSEDYANTFRTAIRLGDIKMVYGEFDSGWFTDSEFSKCRWCCETIPDPFPTYTEIYNIEEDLTEHHNLYNSIDDNLFGMLWDKVDGYWDTMVHSAYKPSDTTAKTVWKEHGYNVVPWIDDEY